jgi:hypothetical protein
MGWQPTTAAPVTCRVRLNDTTPCVRPTDHREDRTTVAAMDLDDARRFALSLPETTEEPHFEASSFRVRSKILATIPPDGQTLRLRVGVDEVRALIDESPAAFSEIVWGKRVVEDWVAVHLAAADETHVYELIEEAWRLRAPKKLVAQHDLQRDVIDE